MQIGNQEVTVNVTTSGYPDVIEIPQGFVDRTVSLVRGSQRFARRATPGCPHDLRALATLSKPPPPRAFDGGAFAVRVSQGKKRAEFRARELPDSTLNWPGPGRGRAGVPGPRDPRVRDPAFRFRRGRPY